jgi:2C-methyl-D-erythritol 2,4-cyclodiphosphate synthase
MIAVSEPYTIKIRLTQRPDPDRYACAVLAIQAALSATGLGDIATVWPDTNVVTDEELGQLSDRWADANPWG